LWPRLFDTVAETGVRDRARELFVDYCVSRKGSRRTCERYAVLVWTGYPGASEPGTPVEFDPDELSGEEECAEAVRQELADCTDSRRCFAYKETVFAFLDGYKTRPEEFADLPSQRPFLRAQEAYLQALTRLCGEYECLIEGHVTPAAVAWAQVRHGG